MKTFYKTTAGKKIFKSSVIASLILLIFISNGIAQTCSINAINGIDQSYDSPCEGSGATFTAILYSGSNGSITWFRDGAAMSSAAYIYQNQLYIDPYYNQDKGLYAAVFTDNNTGCKDTAWMQTDQLTAAVDPQILWVQDLCGMVQMKAVNGNDTTAGNNSYAWMDQDGYYSIFSQYINTSNYTETVEITNSDGCTASTTDYIPESQLKYPTTPVISVSGGSVQVCPGNTRTYTAASQNGINYNWTVPTGAAINNGQSTNSITVSYNNNFAGGQITLVKSNQCGTASKSVSVALNNPPAKPSAISGTVAGLCSLSNKVYSVTNVAGLSYNWSVPSGAVITSGQETSTIHVNFPSASFSGSISVTAANSCGSSTARTLTVKGAPATPASISGSTTVCSGSSGNAYSITPIASASNYTWTAPSGSHITANGVTSSSNVLTTSATSVTVQFGALDSTSIIKVRANNQCGSGSTRSESLTNCAARLTNTAISATITAYPNPTTGNLNVVFTTAINQDIRYSIIDLTGRELLIKNLNATEGVNELTLDLAPFSQGSYYLQLTAEDLKQQIKIIKQ